MPARAQPGTANAARAAPPRAAAAAAAKGWAVNLAAEQEPTAADAELADVEACSSLDGSVSSHGSTADSEEAAAEPPAAAAAAANRGGKGRGRARGKAARGDAGGARGGGGRGRGRGQPTQSKYKWVDVDKHVFTPRVEFDGEENPWLGDDLAHLKWDDAPELWFEAFVAPESEYKERASNSQKYRGWRAGNDMDGPDGKMSYDGAADIEVADMYMLDAFILLAGLDPAVSREKLFASNRLAVVGHRGADLLNRDRLQMLRKFFHPSDPYKKVEKGKAGYDNLICTMLCTDGRAMYNHRYGPIPGHGMSIYM